MGKDADNTIRLEDPWVSAHHCTIAEQKGRYVLSDLDSHAGTFVNGIPVKQRELKGGDEVAIGNSLFLFQEEKVASHRQAAKCRWMKKKRQMRRRLSCTRRTVEPGAGSFGSAAAASSEWNAI